MQEVNRFCEVIFFNDRYDFRCYEAATGITNDGGMQSPLIPLCILSGVGTKFGTESIVGLFL